MMNQEALPFFRFIIHRSSFRKWSGIPYRKKMGADFGGKGTDTSQGTILFLWRPETQIVKHGMLEETSTDCKNYFLEE